MPSVTVLMVVTSGKVAYRYRERVPATFYRRSDLVGHSIAADD